MMDHPGHEHDPAEVTRVVVLVEHDDGRRFGYDVTDIISLRWEWLGVWGRGSIGEVTVSGTFHRVNRYAELDEAIDEQEALEP
jgi:hypothetical protein